MTTFISRLMLAVLALAFAPQLMAADLKAVDPQQVATLQQDKAILIDIRTPEEWRKTGLIPGSQPLTYFDATGHYDTAAWLKQLDQLTTDKNRPIVLICRSGHRSELVGNLLAKELGYGQVYHLRTGIKGWLEQQKPVGACVSC
jgi:rhodanese-related sulfurtransferase